MDMEKPYLIRCSSCRAKNRIPAQKINAKATCGKCHALITTDGLFSGRSVIVTDENFKSEVINSPIPVLLAFWAPWCPSCRVLIPTLERLAPRWKGRIRVAKLNTEQNQMTASSFNVMSVPMMIVFDNGYLMETMVGALPELEITKKMVRYI